MLQVPFLTIRVAGSVLNDRGVTAPFLMIGSDSSISRPQPSSDTLRARHHPWKNKNGQEHAYIHSDVQFVFVVEVCEFEAFPLGFSS